MKVSATDPATRLLLSSMPLLTTMLVVDAGARSGLLPPKSLVAKELLQKELPDTGEQWVTMSNGIEYQPAADLSPLAQLHLRRLTTNDSYNVDNAYAKLFADGAETYYDEYAQAWRALGFYIDCDYEGEQRRRELQDEGEGSGCQRFLLWAAYVDEAYSGGGVGEYMYYNRKANHWDESACDYEDSPRCVKMDCHLPSTHFTLLGFFKEPKYEEWMEQLFKHEGDCVWTDEEFQFMQGNREVWPKGCISSGITAPSSGNSETTSYIYYDIKPSKYGEMNLGLYSDDSCLEEYIDMDAKTLMQELVCGGNGNDDGGNDACTTDQEQDDRGRVQGTLWSLASQMEEWNRGFDVFKQCQPCKTYDITNFVAGKNNYTANSNGDRYNWTSAAQYDRDDGQDEDGDNVFHCHDDAGYDDVNQCMKFKTKTRMMTASWRDVEMANAQGSITAVQAPGLEEGGYQFSSAQKIGTGLEAKGLDTVAYSMAWVMLFVGSALFGGAMYRYKVAKDESDSLQEPLVPSDEGVVA